MKKLNYQESIDREKSETNQQSVCQSGKSFYEYLHGMKFDEDIDDCDYCAAFIFA